MKRDCPNVTLNVIVDSGLPDQDLILSIIQPYALNFYTGFSLAIEKCVGDVHLFEHIYFNLTYKLLILLKRKIDKNAI